MNTRTSLPVAIINTPSPGGLSNQTGGGQAVNQLLVTNSSANTWTAFDLSNITPGRQFLGIADHGFEATGERLVCQHGIKEHRKFRDGDGVALRRDGRMQIGEGCGVVEPIRFGHEAFEELQHPVGAIDEAAQQLVGIDAVVRPSLIQPVLRA